MALGSSVQADGLDSSFQRTRMESFYIMKTIDVSVAENAEFVRTALTLVVDHAIVDVRLVSEPEKDTVVDNFVKSLKSRNNLIFRGA